MHPLFSVLSRVRPHARPAGVARSHAGSHLLPMCVGWWFLLLPIPARAQTTVSLINSGDWSNPAIWSSNPLIPNNGQPSLDSMYGVTITNRMVDLDIDVTITDFTLAHSSGATNVLTSDSGETKRLTIENIFNYRQGIISGDVEVMINQDATMNFQSTPTGLTKQLNATIMNEGTIVIDFLTNLQSTGPLTRLVNGPGGIVNINNSANFSRTAGSVDPVFINEVGAVVNSQGGTTVSWMFENRGTVNVNGGSFTANNGGTYTGTFNIAANRRATFGGTGMMHTFTPDSVVTGPGTVAFSTDARVQNSPANFDVGGIVVNTGDVHFEHAGPGFSFDSVELGGGALFFDDAAGDVTTGSLFWRGGDLGADLTVMGLITGNVTTNPTEPRMLSGMLTNMGLANLQGPLDTNSASGGGTIVNEGTIKTTSTTEISGDGKLVNAGMLKVESGTTTIKVPLETTDDSVLEVTDGARLFVEKAEVLRGIFVSGEDSITNILLSEQDAFLDLVALNMAIAGAVTVSNDQDILNGRADLFSNIGGNGRFTLDGRFEAFNRTSPGESPGTFTIEAREMVMGDTHRLDMEFGAPGSAEVDLLMVNAEELTIDGTLNVFALDGFAAGSYPLIQYSGTLVDMGMEIGAFPTGFEGEVIIDHGLKTVRLDVMSIPEPSVSVLLALSAGWLAGARRRSSQPFQQRRG